MDFSVPFRFIKKILHILLYLLIPFLLSSCSISKVIPIQFSRVPQTETYTQIFTFMDALSACDASKINQNEPDRCAIRQNEKMESVFNDLLGDKNWQTIKDMYGYSSMRQELIKHQIGITGSMAFILYLDPIDQKDIVAEGHGRFYLIDKNKEILLSGDFDLVSEPYYLNSKNSKDYMLVDVKLYVTRIPGQITYIHQAKLKYKIYLKKNFGSKGVFSLDYDRDHEVYLLNNMTGKELNNKNKIAIMTFNGSINKRKISDTRGMGFLRKDYEK